MAEKDRLFFGELFREKRLKLGYTFDYMYRNFDVFPSTLCEIEKGIIKNPSLTAIKRISVGLNIPIQEVFDRIPS